MATKYLDSNGVTYLWQKIKLYVEGIAGNLFAYKKVSSGSTSITAVDGLEEVAFEGSGSATITLTNQAASQGTDAKAVVTVTTPTNLSDFTADSDSQHFTQTEKTKLSGIATGAEVNQNAFSNVKVGSTTVAADSKTDTVEFAVGTGTTGGLTIEGDATNDKVTIKGKSETAASGGTTLSMVTTGEKYTWNNKQDAITSSNKLSADLIEDGTTNKAYTATEKTKLAGIDAGAEVNQNAYSTISIKQGSGQTATTVPIPATSATDTFSVELAGSLSAITSESDRSVRLSAADTKNTAGSNQDASKLFLVGAKSQTTGTNGVQTYSQSAAYITAGKVYSNSKEVVNLSDTQALTNKTYNGVTPATTTYGFTIGTSDSTLTVEADFTLNEACEYGVDQIIMAGSSSTNLPTTAAVESRIASAIATAQTGAAMYQGTAPSPFAPTNYKAGYYWIVGTAGTYTSTTPCEPGDMIFAKADGTTYSASNFDEIQTNLDIASMTTSDIDTAIAAA